MSKTREQQFVVVFDDILDSFLRKECLFFNSKEKLDLFFSRDLIYCNGVVAKKGQKVHAGDIIRLLTPQDFEPAVSTTYSIVYEDDYLFIVNKPAHLPIHPVGKYYFNTLTELLRDAGYVVKGKLFPVHRLDKETSGLVLFAKSKELAKQLQDLFLNDAVEKVYLGICFGNLSETKGQFTWPLKQISTAKLRQIVVVAEDGKPARTEYELLATVADGEFSLLKLRLHSGRKHQIRVHLAHAGIPLVGDKQYGPYPNLFMKHYNSPLETATEIEEKLLMPRHCLHCSQLSFTHPSTGEKLFFRLDLPQDMQSFLNTRGFKGLDN